MEILQRALTEKEIKRCTNKARKVLRGVFEWIDPKQPDAVQLNEKQLAKNKGRVVGKGIGQIVVSIGKAWVGGKRRPFVIKLLRHNAFVGQDRLIVHSNPISNNAMQENMAHALRQEGFPVVLHHYVGEIAPGGIYGVLSEHVGHQKGYRVADLDDVNLDELKNGEQLKTAVEASLGRMRELESRGMIWGTGHGSVDDPALALRRMHHVVVSPDGKAKVLVNDLDHCAVNPKKFAGKPLKDQQSVQENFEWLFQEAFAAYEGKQKIPRRFSQVPAHWIEKLKNKASQAALWWNCIPKEWEEKHPAIDALRQAAQEHHQDVQAVLRSVRPKIHFSGSPDPAESSLISLLIKANDSGKKLPPALHALAVAEKDVLTPVVCAYAEALLLAQSRSVPADTRPTPQVLHSAAQFIAKRAQTLLNFYKQRHTQKEAQ